MQKLKNTLKPIASRVLDIIYPPRCISCGENVHETGNICAKCWSGINFISDPQCKICGFPFDYQVAEGAFCAGCMEEEPKFSKARAVFLYDEVSRDMITSFKYRDRLEGCNAFARWMARIGADMLQEADFIIPVPLHRLKLLARKYNQAALLAHALGKISGRKVLVDGLIRKKYTRKQSGLARKTRFRNIKGAFVANPRRLEVLKGKKILLVDDVLTTGATAEECAKALLRANVERVEVLTLGKTLY